MDKEQERKEFLIKKFTGLGITENVDTKVDICEYLRQGLFKKDACVMAGIDKATFYRWVADDATFATQVKSAILEYKHALIKMITVGVQKTPRVGLDILRARWPKEWNVAKKIELGGEVNVKELDRIADILQNVYKEADDKNTDSDTDFS